jgi:hypothetical protein
MQAIIVLDRTVFVVDFGGDVPDCLEEVLGDLPLELEWDQLLVPWGISIRMSTFPFPSRRDDGA